ncbi:MAG: GNAT family N-acetyltransferase [Verrucomicrobiota bacterium]
MEYRFATNDDLELLAHWNGQLINDEGHWNPASQQELVRRLAEWLQQDYEAIIFSDNEQDVAYALYREGSEEVYLRQFFVRRDQRRKGLGGKAIRSLKAGVWPPNKRINVAALVGNPSAIAFWRAVGFSDYALTLSMAPDERT